MKSNIPIKFEKPTWNGNEVVVTFDSAKRDLVTKFMLKRRGLKDFVRWYELPLYFLYILYTPKPTRGGIIVRYNNDRVRQEIPEPEQDILCPSKSDVIESTRPIN